MAGEPAFTVHLSLTISTKSVYLDLSERLLYKWHNAYVYLLWSDDYRLLRLPDRLFSLYFVLRRFLWVVRRLRDQLSGSSPRGAG